MSQPFVHSVLVDVMNSKKIIIKESNTPTQCSGEGRQSLDGKQTEGKFK